jgi:hypothetical protein
MIRIGKKAFDQDGNGFVQIEEIKLKCFVEISSHGNEYRGKIWKNEKIYSERDFTMENYNMNLTEILSEALEIAQE